MATKEVSNFYFFRSKMTKRVRIPDDELPALHLVSCMGCCNSFASIANPELRPCPLCDSSKVMSIGEYDGRAEHEHYYSPRGISELRRTIAERNVAEELRRDKIGDSSRIYKKKELIIPIPHPNRRKIESQIASWIHVGTADLTGPNSTLDEKKFNSFLRKNNVYPVKQSPGGGKWDSTRIHEPRFEFCFIGSEAKFRNKGPYEIHNRRTGPGIYFYYKGRLYLSDSKEDVLAHVDGVGTKEDDDSRRERIPDDTQIFVWNRDGGACVKCGSRENLAYDHIIPHSLGGSNSRRNLQLLCDSCNSKKSNKIGG